MIGREKRGRITFDYRCECGTKPRVYTGDSATPRKLDWDDE